MFKDKEVICIDHVGRVRGLAPLETLDIEIINKNHRRISIRIIPNEHSIHIVGALHLCMGA